VPKLSRHLAFPLLLLAGLIGLCGCVQVRSESRLDAVGGFDRSLTVVLMKEQMNPDAKTDIASVVALTDGDKWKSDISDAADKITLTASRKFAADERAATDYVLKGKDGPFLECKVEVKKLDGGLLEYTETYTWKGKPLGEDGPLDTEFQKVIAKEFAAAKPTDDQTKEMVSRLKAVVWQGIFGPGEPLFPSLVMDAQLAERKLRIMLFDAMIAEAARVFSESMTEEARREAARKAVRQFTKDALGDAAPPEADPNSPPPSGDSEPISVMQAVVTGPGRVVETNGTYDPVEQQIYWSCYAQAAQLRPVTFRAVFDPTP